MSRRVVLVLAAIAAVASATPGLAHVRHETDCASWPNVDGDLQHAIMSNRCVQLPPGVIPLDRQLNLPDHREVRGAGVGTTTLRALPTFAGTAAFAANGSMGSKLSELTIDLDNNAIGGVGANGIAVEHVRVTGARCWGIGIAGRGMSVRRSVIDHNGGSCPVAPPGAGIYVNAPGNGIARLSPVIVDNDIRDNFGPALDVDSTFGGVFSDNVISGHTAYAALAFYGASDWTIARNTVDHVVAPTARRSHRFCDPGSFAAAPRGAGTAAIALCQDDADHYSVGNRIVDNRVRAYYGILTIGADDVYLRPDWTRPNWVPRRNRFVGNITTGSTVGCADDFRPGQWRHDDNTWRHNDCRHGRRDTPPEYF